VAGGGGREGRGRVEGRSHWGRSHVCVTTGGSRSRLAFEMAPRLPGGEGWVYIARGMPSGRGIGGVEVMDACADV
jgi:hypothetical protein